MKKGMRKESNRKVKRQGFTLVETLLVASLISMVSITVYNAFSNGMKLWERGQHLVFEEDVTIFFDRVSSELRNTFGFSNIRFKGRRHSLEFPAIVRTEVSSSRYFGEKRYENQVGQIGYFFDIYKKNLYKREAKYGQAVNNRSSQERLILSRLKSVDFQYYYISNDGQLIRTDIVDRKPKVVRINVEYLDDKDRPRSLIKTIHIPS